MAQGADTAKLFADAIQAERDEYGKAVGQAASHVRARGENLAGVMQGMASTPVAGFPSFNSFVNPEVKESVSKLVEGELAFYQAMTQTWMDYAAGMESRRNATAQAMLESNAKLLQTGQEAAKSAAKYGEALMQWSLENANGMKS